MFQVPFAVMKSSSPLEVAKSVGRLPIFKQQEGALQATPFPSSQRTSLE